MTGTGMPISQSNTERIRFASKDCLEGKTSPARAWFRQRHKVNAFAVPRAATRGLTRTETAGGRAAPEKFNLSNSSTAALTLDRGGFPCAFPRPPSLSPSLPASRPLPRPSPRVAFAVPWSAGLLGIMLIITRLLVQWQGASRATCNISTRPERRHTADRQHRPRSALPAT